MIAAESCYNPRESPGSAFMNRYQHWLVLFGVFIAGLVVFLSITALQSRRKAAMKTAADESRTLRRANDPPASTVQQTAHSAPAAQAPTHSTLSIKAWVAKPDKEQLNYLAFSVGRLIAVVSKTDKPLAEKIFSWYSHKEPGQWGGEGARVLATSIFVLNKKAETDPRIDLSAIDIEDMLLQTTGKEFTLPDIACTEAGGRACLAETARSAVNDAPAGSAASAPVPPAAEPEPAAPAQDGSGLTPNLFVPEYQVSDFDPQWRGKEVVLHGTISRIDVDTAGEPRYATIYFKEAPDGSVTAFYPYPSIMRARYGRDFSGLIGKGVYLRGEIQPFRDAKGSLRILALSQVNVEH